MWISRVLTCVQSRADDDGEELKEWPQNKVYAC